MPDIDSIETYDYNLPAERIAEYPLANRDQSKLLVFQNNSITDSHFHSIEMFIPENALLVFNDTKVVQARFLFQTSTNATIEIFSLEPAEGDGGPAESMTMHGNVVWKCFVGNAKRWKQRILERKVQYPDGAIISLFAELIEKKEDYYIIQFTWNPTALTFSEILSLLGDLPLPPYMKRKTEEEDKVRYQTVYAREEGSVAAPTAGLHFTKEILTELASKGIQEEYVTLHVGAGTFKPVKTDSISEHQMHSEYISIRMECIVKLLDKSAHTIIPVGTTSMRTLESLYWLGCKLHYAVDHTVFPELAQWDAYTILPIPMIESLQSVLSYLQYKGTDVFIARTSLLIKPGYTFKMCDAIITNFHQPKSTLLCLVSAFVGIDTLKQLYTHALETDYRFLSYGDSSLLFKKNES
ncbi:MAG: S-adenosylmethionine:tRNA ribosyltransferase-isomerase [Cytophagales bacterium]|nr:S-adenosylmethionine:tRNA ribosyltransferase-isomerase [Cytophaga sp.]